MTTQEDPLLNEWYRHLNKGQRFQVVSVDNDDGLIEIQYFDGDLEELEQDQWYEMELESTSAPENWAGALDIAEVDDLGTSITDTATEDWNAPLAEISATDDPASAADSEELSDDWGEGTLEEERWEEQ